MKIKIFTILFALAGIFVFEACKKNTLPTVSTVEIVKLKNDSVNIVANVVSEDDVIEKGICWTTNTEPTIADSKTTEGPGAGDFTSSISGLDEDTVYYFRAYATTEAGTAYGEAKSFNTTMTPQDHFEQMLAWMTGSFSSETHADTTVNQYIVDVRLHCAQIWHDRNVGENIYWVYVEQAYANNLTHPYRQRIYKMILTPDGDMYDEVYSVPNSSTYLHAYQDVSVLDALTEADLTQKVGCDVDFLWNGEYYEGTTTGTGCVINGIPGVNYIVSESSFRPDRMTSWDRGYSSSGQWTMGPDWPYIFDKLEDYSFVPTIYITN